MPKYLPNLSELINNYDIFIIDVGGVIHDGVTQYKGSLNALKTLREHNKQVILLTNAPRPKDVIAKKINDLGYQIEKEKIITSGDYYFHDISYKLNSDIQESALLIGAEKNKDLNLHNYYNLVDNVQEAQILIILAYLEAFDNLNIYDHLFKTAAELNIPAICPNPDAVVYYGDIVRHPAGYFAIKYESLGGKVLYYGKPYIDIYEFSLSGFNYDKSKILAIGDNLETDILGANNFGIDSVLIAKGIYKDVDNLDLLIEQHKISPTYICDYFTV